ncbi:MAG: MFS transporter [Candidatus Jorgensenbacteria bacterium]|nr:MFS transporter [Candidatus Jorgensenbacteria bacterium]
MSKTKATILLTVFIDVIGLGIVIPILPFYVSSFSNSAFLITSLFAVYALCSFFSAPVIGALSDRVGRRPMLIGSIFSTAIGWFVFASATSVLFLFIGRIIDGIMAGNFPIAQGYLTDISKDDKERTTNMGLIGAVFGIGFILGPFLGGLLGQFGHTVPFWFVGGLALFNGVLALFILPETHKALSDKPISINPFSPLIRAIKSVELRSNYLAWLFFGLAIASYQAIFSLYLRDVFHLTEMAGGIIFGLIGVIIAINQGLVMKHVWLKYFKEPVLELIMLIVFAVGFLFLTVNFFVVFCIALILTTFGQSVLRVVMTSQVVGQSPQTQRGEILGILSSITSISMMVGPFVSGMLYEQNKSLPFLFSAFYLAIAFYVLYKRRRTLANIELPEDVAMDSMI